MSPERRALLDSLLVERFTPYRPNTQPVDPATARQHRDQLTPRLRLVRNVRKGAS